MHEWANPFSLRAVCPFSTPLIKRRLTLVSFSLGSGACGAYGYVVTFFGVQRGEQVKMMPSRRTLSWWPEKILPLLYGDILAIR